MRGLLLFLLTVSVILAQSFEDFQRRLEDVKSLKVVFVQKVQYPWQSKPDVSKGTFYAQRGGRFRIEYEQPENTLIVSDGMQVMVYVPKDRTAFLDRIERNSSPVVEALFLVSRPLSEVFELVGEIDGSKGRTFILKPKVRDDYFSKVLVEVSPRGDIRSIRVEEKSGTNTTIEFLNVSTNFTPSETLFRVKVPEGARVIRP
ncbi:outer membrane lipoprotein chaperone LolA [Pampinifervens florentissimum]|uniref:outer membrane lipoprotein chaperone LolA n=1 Tax=Pampinifervens florentissimum TaxID=1632019 RepID=UPI0013B48392|nr:outer membrane lipoprotein chaperone LolA [Hydrogenobacter sp. T-8]QID32759.1 outer membrane lipoprotein chaperone LolA [Hydrogenobacter sp. T-8]